MIFRRSSILLIGALLVLSAQAKLVDIDFSKRSSEFDNKMFETTVESPKANPRLMTKQYGTTRYSVSRHRLADQKFSVERMDLFQSNRYPTEELDLEMRDTDMFRNSGQVFSSGELDRIRFNTLHHDAKRESRLADSESAIDVEEFLDQLSLADLNRYQFRRSRSREPGFPTQQAAGNQPAD